MKPNSKLTWGLAWTGLAVVLAVPTADLLTRAMSGGGSAVIMTSDTENVRPAPAAQPTQTASVTTTRTATGVTITPNAGTAADPVDRFLDSGKDLPDYISGGGTASAPATATPARPATPTSPTLPTAPDMQVAAIDPAQTAAPAPRAVAPTPFPAWARPKPSVPVASAPPASQPPVVIVDETRTGSIAGPGRPMPPAGIEDDPGDWDTESLRQYLERRGILEGGSGGAGGAPSGAYDANGFYLSDGPNSERARSRRERLEMIFEEDDDSFLLF